eukprot:m.118693 g.118693  ORF g.118693 m.118693 type:complete len:661 (+) comp15570_c0_seq3:149-2131(+)
MKLASWTVQGLIVLVTAAVFVLTAIAAQNALLKQTGYQHRSALEKQLLLYSEQAFYYSFYTDVANAATWQDAYFALSTDNRTEHPDTINSLSRFNVWPEAITAVAYRSVAHTVSMPPQDFYNAVLVLLAGLQWAGLCYLIASCTRNPAAGVLGLLLCGLLVKTATRLPSQPALRENWAMPWFWWHTAALCQLVQPTGRAQQQFATAVYLVTGVCMICSWQFTPFLLLLQLVAVFGGYVCNSLLLRSLHTYLKVSGLLLLLGTLAMGFNSMVYASLWACSLATTAAVVSLLPSDRVLAHNIAQGFIIAVGALASKALATLWFTDDVHVANLLRAKLFGFEDLLTALYLCDGTYSGTTWAELTAMGTIPWIGAGATALVTLVVLVVSYDYLLAKPHVAILPLLVFQALLLSLLGLAVRRLSILLVPSLSMVICLCFQAELWTFLLALPRQWSFLLGWRDEAAVLFKLSKPLQVCLQLLAVAALAAVLQSTQFQITLSELKSSDVDPNSVNRDPATASLMRFLKRRVPTNEPILADGVISSTIRLVTKNPIIIHPQVETQAMRLRYHRFFQLYGSATEEQAAAIVRGFGARYVILSEGPCRLRCGPEKHSLMYYVSLPNEVGANSSYGASSVQTCLYVKQHSNNLAYFTAIYDQGPFLVLKLR